MRGSCARVAWAAMSLLRRSRKKKTNAVVPRLQRRANVATWVPLPTRLRANARDRVAGDDTERGNQNRCPLKWHSQPQSVAHLIPEFAVSCHGPQLRAIQVSQRCFRNCSFFCVESRATPPGPPAFAGDDTEEDGQCTGGPLRSWALTRLIGLVRCRYSIPHGLRANGWSSSTIGAEKGMRA